MTYRATLKVNGIVVGDFEASLDDAENAQGARQLLTQVGFEHSQPHEAAFRQAESFAYAVETLAKTGDWRSVAPIVTNGCFAVELYFKAILLANRKAERKQHSLVGLFQSLGEEIQNRAESLYAASDQKEAAIATFRQLVENLDNGFTDWRYLHEGKPTNVVSVLSVLVACSVANELCAHQLAA